LAVPAGQAGVISSGGLFWFPGLDAVHNRCAPTALVAPEGHVPGRMDPSLGQRFVGGWQQAATPLDPRIQALPLSSPWAHQLQYADPPLGRQTQLENLRWQARVTQDPNTNGHRHLVQHSNNETLSHQPSTYTALQPSVYAAHGQAALPQVQQRVRSGPVISPGDRGYQAGKLFLGGLPESVREQDLKEYCRRWGSIVDIVVMSGRGFGFVTFAMEDHARAFCEHKQHRLGGRLIDVQFAVPRPEQPPPTREKAVPYTSSPGTALKLFIGGIPEVSDADFYHFFARFGAIEDSVVMRTNDGVPRGFGFITYAHIGAVERCLAAQPLEFNGKRIEVKRATPRSATPPSQQKVKQTCREGDWECTRCGNINFAFRECCNTCRAVREAWQYPQGRAAIENENYRADKRPPYQSSLPAVGTPSSNAPPSQPGVESSNPLLSGMAPGSYPQEDYHGPMRHTTSTRRRRHQPY